MIYFTSDTHFSHANIIKYCNRPFADVDEMNRELIKRWNDTVPADYIVIHMGDFALGNPKLMQPIFDQLNGTKVLVRGNHDSTATTKLGWTQVLKKEIRDLHRMRAICIHDPAALNPDDLATDGRKNVILHGHCHGNAGHHRFDKISGVHYIDVGVDCTDYRPVSAISILAPLVHTRN